MKRNIYKNNNPYLRELKQLRDPKVLAKEVRRMALQINQRFYRLEKKGQANDTAYKYAQNELEMKKPRYSVNQEKLENMSIQELYEIGIEINSKLVSKTSTLSGRKEIKETRINSALDSLFGSNHDVSVEDWDTFLSNGGGEMLNSRWIDSKQLAEDWREFTQEGGVSQKQFLYEYNRIKNKERFDYGALTKRLTDVKKRNKARKGR